MRKMNQYFLYFYESHILFKDSYLENIFYAQTETDMNIVQES